MGVADVTIEELSGDPHTHLARLRAESPAAWVPSLGAHLVTSREAALAVLRDPERFTVDDQRFSTGQVVGRSMLSLDGDEHARHRQPFAGPFRPRQVGARFRTFVDAEVDRRLDRVQDGDGAELRGALAAPLAAAVVAESLGMDGRDEHAVDRLVGWYREIVASVAGVSAGQAITAAGDDAVAELAATLDAHMSGHSLLAEAVSTGGLTPEEVISNAAVIMFGGIETTEAMILNVVWHLLGDADELAQVAASPDLAAAAAVEESLRMEPAAAVVDRYTTADVELAGTQIAHGAMVTVSLAAANRDPAEFADPDRFDVRRTNLRRQLAFASGPHVCIGMDLARLEARAALAALLARFPALRLVPGSPPPTGLVFRKPSRLDVTWR